MQTLKEFKSFEPIEDTEKRVTVIKKLTDIGNTWIKMIIASRVSKGSNVKTEGKCVAFGFYWLGVHSSGGDIDSVLIAPSSKIKKLNAAGNAFVLLMTMECDGVEVDLLIACMDLATIPANLDLTSDSPSDQESLLMYPKVLKFTSKTQSVLFIGLEFTDVNKNLDLTTEIENFKKTVDEKAKMQVALGDVQLDISYVKRANLIKIIPAAEQKKLLWKERRIGKE
ncbi:hypothetical protein CAEBREN_24044 [Caenorhabditis brenneri]|uniref:Uncharacterized protein n=1 Tax=Caenorhabditis brenneri TaxID=135651 RepID=G0MVE2_CAEBE|nr:hypothetical protein CAEBREN_24044 [Caenorhabditis brenneri]